MYIQIATPTHIIFRLERKQNKGGNQMPYLERKKSDNYNKFTIKSHIKQDANKVKSLISGYQASFHMPHDRAIITIDSKCQSHRLNVSIIFTGIEYPKQRR